MGRSHQERHRQKELGSGRVRVAVTDVNRENSSTDADVLHAPQLIITTRFTSASAADFMTAEIRPPV